MEAPYDPIESNTLGGIPPVSESETVPTPSPADTVEVRDSAGNVYQVPRSALPAKPAPEPAPTPGPSGPSRSQPAGTAYRTDQQEAAVLDSATVEGDEVTLYVTTPRTGHRFSYKLSGGERADGIEP